MNFSWLTRACRQGKPQRSSRRRGKRICVLMFFRPTGPRQRHLRHPSEQHWQVHRFRSEDAHGLPGKYRRRQLVFTCFLAACRILRLQIWCAHRQAAKFELNGLRLACNNATCFRLIKHPVWLPFRVPLPNARNAHIANSHFLSFVGRHHHLGL